MARAASMASEMSTATDRWASPLYTPSTVVRFHFKLEWLLTIEKRFQSIGGCNSEQIDGWVLSSETCALLPIGAKFYRDVLPGEIVQLSRKGLRSLGRVQLADNKKYAFCIFEYVYFARPDSFFEGIEIISVKSTSLIFD